MSGKDDTHTAATGKLRELFDASQLYSLKRNSYFDVYERTACRFVGKGTTFVEVGGRRGGLQMWKAFFQDARVIGVDIDPSARELTQLGVEIVIGDQASSEFWERFYKTVGPIDVLIDDGGHSNGQQIATVAHAIAHTRDQEVILVEDVHASYMGEFLNPTRHSFINFAKYLVDRVNSRAAFVTTKLPHRNIIASIEFHESIVIIHVDRSHSIQSLASRKLWQRTRHSRTGSVPFLWTRF